MGLFSAPIQSPQQISINPQGGGGQVDPKLGPRPTIPPWMQQAADGGDLASQANINGIISQQAAWDKAAGSGASGVQTTNTFNPTDPNSVDYSGALAKQQGYQDTGLANALQTRGQTQGLISDLTAQANGTGGPSLAEQQLGRSLGTIQSQAAGSIASQKGINPALAARLVAQQQTSASQNTAGQAADLRVQEQLAARQQLAQVLQGQQQSDLGFGQQGLQGAGLYGQLGYAQQGLSAQLAEANKQRQLQAMLANQSNATQMAGINAGVSVANNQAAGSMAGGVMGAVGTGLMLLSKGGKVPALTPKDLLPADKVPLMQEDNTPGATTQGVGMKELQTPQKMAFGGLSGMQGAGLALSSLGSGMAGRGSVGFNSGLVSLGQQLRMRQQAQTAAQGASSILPSTPGQGVLASGGGMAPVAPAPAPGTGVIQQPSLPPQMMAQPGLGLPGPGGTIPGAPSSIIQGPQSGISQGPMAMRSGGQVGGQAKVSGDSEKNDTVPVMLSPGEIVVPRSKANDPNAAAEFVKAIASHKHEPEPEGYAGVLKKTRDLHERLKKVEAMCAGGMAY